MIIQNGVGITTLLNGNTVKQALNPANETVNRGIYLATTLSAVDVDLATPNIKSGIDIFGKPGSTDVRDSTDADAAITDVKDPKTFYAGGGARKTGTMPTVALNPAANAYPAGYHAGAASLTAVDGDLAAGNIKNGVTIFGVLGTYTLSLAEDTTGGAKTALVSDASDTRARLNTTVADGADSTVATQALTFDANSMAVAVGVACVDVVAGMTWKLRLYMGGVQVAESGVIDTNSDTIVLVATRALSGAQTCYIAMHNYSGVSTYFTLVGAESGAPKPLSAGIGVGSIKVV